MRIGVCTSASGWKTVAEVGYDYVEGNLATIAAASDAEFDDMLNCRAEAGIDVEACNCFFPGAFVLYAKDGDTATVEANVRDYLEIAMSRAQKLGVRITVLGSSRSRTIPDGFPRKMAEEQFLRVLRICGDIGEKYGIKITVEPLNTNETNFINTYADGLEFCRRVAHPNIFTMIDLYHHAVNGEPMSTVDGTRGVLIHAHISRPDRTTPTLADSEILSPRVRYLKQAGYDGRLSLECRHIPDFATSVRDAYELLKQYR